MRFASTPILLGTAFAVSGVNALPRSLVDRQEFTQPAPPPAGDGVPKNTVPKNSLPEEPPEEELTGMPAIDGPKNFNMWCGPSTSSIMDWDTAQSIYDMTGGGVGGLTEVYLDEESESPRPPRRWLEDIGRWILHENDGVIRDDDVQVGGAAGCLSVGSDCSPHLRDLESCRDYFYLDHPNIAWVKQSYWLFEAIKGMHAIMKEADARLTRVTISNGLSINSLVDDFRAGMELADDNEGSMQAYNMAGAALGILSAVGGFVPGVGTGIAAGASVLSSMLGLFEPDEPAPITVNIGSIETALNARFTSISDNIDRLLETVTGYADNHEQDYARQDKLGGVEGDEYSISQMLSSPMWFLNPKSTPMKELFDKAEHYMQLKLVESVLTGLGLEIVGRNGEIKGGPRNKDECEGTEHGRRWLRVTGTQTPKGQHPGEETSKHWCFGLSHVGRRDQDWTEVADSTQVYAKMGEYGIDRLSQFYLSAIECERRRFEGKSTTPMPGYNDGDYPICMYTMPVKRAWTNFGADHDPKSTGDFFRYFGWEENLFIPDNAMVWSGAPDQ